MGLGKTIPTFALITYLMEVKKSKWPIFSYCTTFNNFKLGIRILCLQRLMYEHMKKGLLLDSSMKSGRRALQNTIMHLRKLCNHPFLFESIEQDCGKFWGS